MRDELSLRKGFHHLNSEEKTMSRVPVTRSIVLVALVVSLATMLWLCTSPSAMAGQPGITLVPSNNATSVGVPVGFQGTTAGLNASSVTCMEVAPAGGVNSIGATVSSSQFSFNYAFGSVGNWTVFCVAGSVSSPLAESGNVTISVGAIPSATYLGIPVVWVGISILVISAASLIYLVYAIRKRTLEEERKGGPGVSSSP
jgi:hypothetical protein